MSDKIKKISQSLAPDIDAEMSAEIPKKAPIKAPIKSPPAELSEDDGVSDTTKSPMEQKQNIYSPTSSAGEAIQSVKAMQQQILDLHTDLSKDDTFAWKGKTSVSAEQAGADPFLNFIFSNYVQGDITQHDFGQSGYAEKDMREKGKDIKEQSSAKTAQNILPGIGKPAVMPPTAPSTTPAPKPPTSVPATSITNTMPGFAKSLKGKEAYDLRAVLNSIQAVGKHTSKGENTPDGIWGPRTNDALKNIYIFADAMLKLKSELGLVSESYTPGELSELKALIPPEPPTTKKLPNQIERAKKLTQHIAKVRGLFDEFKKKVFEHPEYKALIQQQKAFPTKVNAKSKPIQLDAHQKNIYDNYMKKSPNKEVAFINKSLKSEPGTTPLDIANKYGIKLNDITNLENFKKFLKDEQITIDGQDASSSPQNIMKAYQKIKETVDNQKV